MSNFLTNKKIVEILDGDTSLLLECGVEYRMPYLSGRDICDIGTAFGANMSYSRSQTLPRYEYMAQVIEYCSEHKKMSKLLCFLFKESQFKELIKNYFIKLDDYISRVKELAINQINDLLFVSNHKIEMIGDKFMLTNTDNNLDVNVAAIKNISIDYIRDIFARTYQEIELGNYDSAITKARTTMEEVFHYIIESENIVPSDSGKLDDLYKQVKQILNMKNNPQLDSRINGLLSALNSIVNNIASMRNISSDSHGLGKARIKLDKHHTKLVVNSATIVCEFVLESYNKQSY